MYCVKCGKYLDGNLEMCAECAKTEAPAQNEFQDSSNNAPQYGAPQNNVNYNQTISNVTPVRQGSRTAGLGFGIAGFIVVIVAAFIIGIGYGSAYSVALEVAMGNYYGNVETFKATLNSATIVCWVGVVMAIVGVVFGPIAIAKFVKTKKTTGVKPVPTLVFGIISLAEAASTILLGFIFIADIANALYILA